MAESDALAMLRAENARLIALLHAHGIEWRSPPETAYPASGQGLSRLSTQEKVALFRRLFRGRDDVYPVRWESKTSGESGYTPACAIDSKRMVIRVEQGTRLNAPQSLSVSSQTHPPPTVSIQIPIAPSNRWPRRAPPAVSSPKAYPTPTAGPADLIAPVELPPLAPIPSAPARR